MENKETGESREREISLKDIFKTFKNGLWIMVVAAVVFAAAAFGYTKIFIPKTYTTNVKFYVETSASGGGSYNDMNALNYATALVDNYIAMLETNNFASQLSDQLENKYSAGQLRKMIKFKSNDDSKNNTANQKNTMVFSATITAGNPNDAYRIAEEVGEIAPEIITDKSKNATLQVIDNPTYPEKPSGPNAKKNALFAGIIGFVLALIFVFVREALDNKVKYTNDMTEINGVPILSAIPDFGEERIILGKEPVTPNATAAESEAK